MSEAQKETIYIDVDDDITSVIDKVKSSNHKIIALVLPKRATVLQSVVNMKLLKRSAETAKKNVVLITSEAGLMPLAGAVGVHVAKNLQSKPAIPAAPEAASTQVESIASEELGENEEVPAANAEPTLDETKSIGELAGDEAPAAVVADEAIELDNDDKPEADGTAADKKANSKKDKKSTSKDSKLKVPNFERFRKWLIFGGVALVVILIGGYFAFFRLPKATITIVTDSTDTQVTANFTANTANNTFDPANKLVPAQWATTKKTDTQSAPATGQKNIGNKASGSVSMTTKVCGSFSSPSPVASGTGVSANGLTYITDSTVTFTPDTISGGCVNFKGSSTTITAQNPGSNYNTGTTTFSVAGRSDIAASGSASGGTDNVVKVVSQSDIDAAKAKSNTASNGDAAKNELTNNLQKSGYLPLTTSFASQGPDITTSAKVGDQADNVTVTSTTTYTMLGVNKDDLNKVVNDQINGQIDSSKQAIQNNGLATATYTVNGKDNPQVSVSTTATIGPNINADQLKKDVAGKKKAETESIVSSQPSVKGATVQYSPFWVMKTPSNPNKIIIVYQKAR